MDRLAEAFPYGCPTHPPQADHPQSSVALRFEAATHLPGYFHTHAETDTRGWIFVPIRGQMKALRQSGRTVGVGSYKWQDTMLDGQTIDVLSMFLMGPREVLVIVIVTAVVVWLRVRRRP